MNQEQIDALAEALRSQGLTWSQTNFAVSLVRNAAADREVLRHQRDSLVAALRKVLDTHEAEAKAFASWQNALENFSDGGARECAAHTRAMTAASDAEREARVLLLTLKIEKGGGNG